MNSRLARDISPDGQIQSVLVGELVESGRDVEGHELKQLGRGIDNVVVQAILELDKGCISCAQRDQPDRQQKPEVPRHFRHLAHASACECIFHLSMAACRSTCARQFS